MFYFGTKSNLLLSAPVWENGGQFTQGYDNVGVFMSHNCHRSVTYSYLKKSMLFLAGAEKSFRQVHAV